MSIGWLNSVCLQDSVRPRRVSMEASVTRRVSGCVDVLQASKGRGASTVSFY